MAYHMNERFDLLSSLGEEVAIEIVSRWAWQKSKANAKTLPISVTGVRPGNSTTVRLKTLKRNSFKVTCTWVLEVPTSRRNTLLTLQHNHLIPLQAHTY